MSKLNRAAVAEIKRRLVASEFRAGEFRERMASEFGVTRSAIDEIVKDRNWKAVPWPEDRR